MELKKNVIKGMCGLDQHCAVLVWKLVFQNCLMDIASSHQEIGADGMVQWIDQSEHTHRGRDRPAIICPDGTMIWCRHGLMHRSGDRPAFIDADGTQSWYMHGYLHRDGDQPAIIRPDGTREWFVRGQLHRDGGQPAVIDANGFRDWYVRGNLCGADPRPLSSASARSRYLYGSI